MTFFGSDEFLFQVYLYFIEYFLVTKELHATDLSSAKVIPHEIHVLVYFSIVYYIFQM